LVQKLITIQYNLPAYAEAASAGRAASTGRQAALAGIEWPKTTCEITLCYKYKKRKNMLS